MRAGPSGPQHNRMHDAPEQERERAGDRQRPDEEGHHGVAMLADCVTVGIPDRDRQRREGENGQQVDRAPIRGLLSELAAVGFARFGAALVAGVREDATPKARLAAIGHGYVTFAQQNPGLFLLMFRSERLDFNRPALRTAAQAAFGVLARAVGAHREARSDAPLTLSQAAQITAAWSLVHGFAMLMLDGRLKPLIARMRDGTDEMALLAAILSGPKGQL